VCVCMCVKETDRETRRKRDGAREPPIKTVAAADQYQQLFVAGKVNKNVCL